MRQAAALLACVGLLASACETSAPADETTATLLGDGEAVALDDPAPIEDPAESDIGNDGEQDGDADDTPEPTEEFAPSDGFEWRRATDDNGDLGGPGQQLMLSVAPGGPGMVAVGVDTGRVASAAWTSDDGQSWERAPHDESVLGGGKVMYSVAAYGTELVAVGYVRSGGDVAAVWTSSDGRSWERVPHDGAVFGGDDEDHRMNAVTAGGPGLVAVGVNAYRARPAVWTSPDGRSWEHVPHDSSAFGDSNQVMGSVTVGGPGLVAVGFDGGLDEAAVWTSPDGLSWQRIDPHETVFGRAKMADVVDSPFGLVAVGSVHDREGRESAAIWVSLDGVGWESLTLDGLERSDDPVERMDSVVYAGDGLVAVGHESSGDLTQGRAVVWRSPDGRTWERVGDEGGVLGGEGVQRMLAVAHGRHGLVAVGTDVANALDETGDATSAAAWTSP